MTQRWQSVGRSAGPALIVDPAGMKKKLYSVDADKIFIQNICKTPPKYTLSDPKTWYSSF
jgi:hypothetical protein